MRIVDFGRNVPKVGFAICSVTPFVGLFFEEMETIAFLLQ